jgi:polygalacturonase
MSNRDSPAGRARAVASRASFFILRCMPGIRLFVSGRRWVAAMLALCLLASAGELAFCAAATDAAQGKEKQTAAVQKLLDDRAAAGGGVVRLSAGTYVCGSLFIKSGVTLQLDKGATILGSEDDADYPIVDTRIAGIEMKHPAALINAIDAKDVALIGEGAVDGSGKKWWDVFWHRRAVEGRGVDFKVLRPRLVCFTRCDGVRVSGLTLQNPAFWTLHILYSQNVDIDGLTIRAPKKAASSDGIDIDSSHDVRVSHCDISCDDDDICVKSGRDADGLRVNRPSYNIAISDCRIGKGGGISMGSETAGGIHDVTVSRCVFDGTSAAVRLKSMPGRGGVVERISYSDITAKDVDSVIDMNLRWGGDDWKKFVEPRFATTVPAEMGTPAFRDVTIRNLNGTGKSAGALRGLSGSPIANITFDNVRIQSQKGMTITYADDLHTEGLKIDVKEGEPIVRKSVDKGAGEEPH